jgi:hypothetical protein
MRDIKTYAAVTVVTLAFLAIPGPARGHTHQPLRTAQAQTSRTQATVVRLRGQIGWNRDRTQHYRRLAMRPPAPTAHAELRTRSVHILRKFKHLWNVRRIHAKAHLNSVLRSSDPADVPVILYYVFGKTLYPEALHIVRGESGFQIGAANGQYLGLFQMGSGERAANATIGYSTALEQTVAAHNLYLSRGWEPWTCCGE